MKTGLVFLVTLLAFSGLAYADLAALDEAANSDVYIKKVPAMLFRGITHVFLSPGEVVYGIYDRTVHGDPFIGTIEGIGVGTKHMLDRGGRGVVDVVAFLVPKFHGYPANVDFPTTSS